MPYKNKKGESFTSTGVKRLPKAGEWFLYNGSAEKADFDFRNERYLILTKLERSKQFAIKTNSQLEHEGTVAYLKAFGIKPSFSNIPFNFTLYPYITVYTDGTGYGGNGISNDGWPEITLSEFTKIWEEQIKRKINVELDGYTAIISREMIEVSCQKISYDKLREIIKAAKELGIDI